jgi:nitrite reductase/ring-hydroxylating ferredoxin subunit
LEGGVVTCPRHGSQFDVSTGERLRGPADTDIATWPTVADGGQLYLLVPD